MFPALDELRLSHLWLLALVHETTEGPPDMYMGGIDSVITWKVPGADMDAIKRDWADLARHNILQGYPSGMMTASGAGNLSVRVTDFGRAFLRFVTVEP